MRGALAAAFAVEGVKAVPENLSLQVHAEVGALYAGLLDWVRAAAPDLWPASLATRATENLKFSDCVPPAAARRMMELRLNDLAAVRHVAAEPVR